MNTVNTIIIRQATIRDAISIRAVLTASQWFTYQSLYSKAYIEKMISQYYNLERIEQEIVTVNVEWHGYFIAEENGQVIGVIGGGMMDETTGEIYVFYLEPDLRGKGVGTKLLSFFTKIQKFQYGAKEQWVSVARGNVYGIPFYEARGFLFQYEAPTYGSTLGELDISLKYKRKV